MNRNIRQVAIAYATMLVMSLIGSPHAWGATPDEAARKAIRAAGEAYLAAMQQGDVEALRSMWTDEGDYVDAAGVVHKARDLFRKRSAQAVATEESDATPKWDSTLRLVTPNVAIEDGVLRFVGEDDGSVLARRFTAIWVERDGRWLLDGLRESTVTGPVVKSQLRELDWLVGEWAGKSGDIEMLVSTHYSEDGNFLVRTSMVRAPSGDVLTGTERIGWDSKRQVIESHTFDSTGSTSEATWRNVDGTWVVDSTVTLPNGQQATTQCSYQSIDPQNYRWSVAKSEADGEEMPSQQIEFQRAADE